MIEDYYYFKYSTKCIISDWQNFYFEYDEPEIIGNEYVFKLNKNILNIIMTHINYKEFQMLKSISEKYYLTFCSDHEFLVHLLNYNGRRRLINAFRFFIIRKLNNNNIKY